MLMTFGDWYDRNINYNVICGCKQISEIYRGDNLVYTKYFKFEIIRFYCHKSPEDFTEWFYDEKARKWHGAYREKFYGRGSF